VPWSLAARDFHRQRTIWCHQRCDAHQPRRDLLQLFDAMQRGAGPGVGCMPQDPRPRINDEIHQSGQGRPAKLIGMMG
jgi:hypothetical protein